MQNWPSVTVEALPEAERPRFERRASAIRAYLGGASMNFCADQFGLSRQEIYRLLERCLAPHPDGRHWGFRALIDHQHLVSYHRVKPIAPAGATTAGASGALGRLFAHHPDIQEQIDALYLRQKTQKKPLVHEPRITLQSLHRQFLRLCREAGVPDTEWPFNTAHQGIRSLGQYVRKLEAQHVMQATRARHGEAAARQLGTGDAAVSDPVARPFQRVQFDGHRVDALMTVTMPSPLGGVVAQTLERIWLLTIQEMLSRAILGYAISLSPEYTANDVLRCVEYALAPWKPQTLTIPGLQYPTNAGLPSGVIPAVAWACWDELSYDNGKANRAYLVRQRLTEVVGCAIIAGPPGTPERRGQLERWFGIFEEHGFHRIPSTVGGGPADPRRRDPEQAAHGFQITLNEITQLMDVLIARYNTTPQEGLGFNTPLEALRHYVDDPDTWTRTLPLVARESGYLRRLTVARHVAGNPANGHRPYIHYENVRYHNPVLARSPGLIGQTLHLTVNPEDIRVIEAALPDGSSLGPLTAHGVWGRTPHSLAVRRAVFRLRNRRDLFWSDTEDPIDVYLQYLATKGQTQKRARNRWKQAKDGAGQAAPPAASPDVTPDEAVPAPPADPPRRVAGLKAILY